MTIRRLSLIFIKCLQIYKWLGNSCKDIQKKKTQEKLKKQKQKQKKRKNYFILFDI